MPVLSREEYAARVLAADIRFARQHIVDIGEQVVQSIGNHTRRYVPRVTSTGQYNDHTPNTSTVIPFSYEDRALDAYSVEELSIMSPEYAAAVKGLDDLLLANGGEGSPTVARALALVSSAPLSSSEQRSANAEAYGVRVTDDALFEMARDEYENVQVATTTPALSNARDELTRLRLARELGKAYKEREDIQARALEEPDPVGDQPLGFYHRRLAEHNARVEELELVVRENGFAGEEIRRATPNWLERQLQRLRNIRNHGSPYTDEERLLRQVARENAAAEQAQVQTQGSEVANQEVAGAANVPAQGEAPDVADLGAVQAAPEDVALAAPVEVLAPAPVPVAEPAPAEPVEDAQPAGEPAGEADGAGNADNDAPPAVVPAVEVPVAAPAAARPGFWARLRTWFSRTPAAPAEAPAPVVAAQAEIAQPEGVAPAGEAVAQPGLAPADAVVGGIPHPDVAPAAAPVPELDPAAQELPAAAAAEELAPVPDVAQPAPVVAPVAPAPAPADVVVPPAAVARPVQVNTEGGFSVVQGGPQDGVKFREPMFDLRGASREDLLRRSLDLIEHGRMLNSGEASQNLVSRQTHAPSIARAQEAVDVQSVNLQNHMDRADALPTGRSQRARQERATFNREGRDIQNRLQHRFVDLRVAQAPIALLDRQREELRPQVRGLGVEALAIRAALDARNVMPDGYLEVLEARFGPVVDADQGANPIVQNQQEVDAVVDQADVQAPAAAAPVPELDPAAQELPAAAAADEPAPVPDVAPPAPPVVAPVAAQNERLPEFPLPETRNPDGTRHFEDNEVFWYTHTDAGRAQMPVRGPDAQPFLRDQDALMLRLGGLDGYRAAGREFLAQYNAQIAADQALQQPEQVAAPAAVVEAAPAAPVPSPIPGDVAAPPAPVPVPDVAAAEAVRDPLAAPPSASAPNLEGAAARQFGRGLSEQPAYPAEINSGTQRASALTSRHRRAIARGEQNIRSLDDPDERRAARGITIKPVFADGGFNPDEPEGEHYFRFRLGQRVSNRRIERAASSLRSDADKLRRRIDALYLRGFGAADQKDPRLGNPMFRRDAIDEIVREADQLELEAQSLRQAERNLQFDAEQNNYDLEIFPAEIIPPRREPGPGDQSVPVRIARPNLYSHVDMGRLDVLKRAHRLLGEREVLQMTPAVVSQTQDMLLRPPNPERVFSILERERFKIYNESIEADPANYVHNLEIDNYSPEDRTAIQEQIRRSEWVAQTVTPDESKGIISPPPQMSQEELDAMLLTPAGAERFDKLPKTAQKHFLAGLRASQGLNESPLAQVHAQGDPFAAAHDPVDPVDQQAPDGAPAPELNPAAQGLIEQQEAALAGNAGAPVQGGA